MNARLVNLARRAAAACAACFVLAAASPSVPSSDAVAPIAARAATPLGGWEKRWVFISSDLSVGENMRRIEIVLLRSRELGYNGVLFSDLKTFSWWLLDKPERWKANAATLRKLATELGLELVVSVLPFGYGEPFFVHDPNLAAGVPVTNAPLVRRGDRLVPEQTARIENGSFEDNRGNRAAAFGVQDDPDRGSFIDRAVCKDGRASLRFENVGTANPHGLGRAFQRVAVRPWQQYRIRVWMKAEHLTARMVSIVAIANRKDLQYQNLVVPGEGGLDYLSEASDLTMDWVEQSVTFNSLGNSSVIIGAGVWGGTSGRLWLDALRVDAVPAMNVLRRETAPLRITGARGFVFEEGRDFNRVVDPLLGSSRWRGNFDTRHEPPAIMAPPGSRIREGERVRLSCYHPAIFYRGQVSCTLDDPGVFARCADQIARTREALSPDGYLLAYDEIRCAGWEPSQRKNFKSAGALLAFNVERCCEIAREEGGNKPLYVWSDMFDPYHNARKDYYLVNGSLSKSWEGLDPRVVVVKWGEPEKAARSIEFFTGRKNRVMIAAFYDEDVRQNRAAWGRVIAGSPRLDGVMYTTWRADHSKLEEFAKAWWGE